MKFEGKPDFTIELKTYDVLETYHSRPRAIWRYICFAFRDWRNETQFSFEFRSLLFWFHRIKGFDRERAIGMAQKMIEGRIFDASMKGEKNGDGN